MIIEWWNLIKMVLLILLFVGFFYVLRKVFHFILGVKQHLASIDQKLEELKKLLGK